MVVRRNLIGHYLARLKLEKYCKIVAFVSLDKSVAFVRLFFYSRWGEGGKLRVGLYPCSYKILLKLSVEDLDFSPFYRL